MKTVFQPRVVALVVLTAALVAPSVGAEWTQEPTAVLGIPLGGKLSELPLPECTPDAMPLRANVGATNVQACRRGEDLYGMPNLGFRYLALLESHDGRVAKVVLSLKHGDFARMQELLVEKYGEPTSRAAREVSSAMGKFQAATLQWEGLKVSVTANERAGAVTDSLVVFAYKELAAQADQARRERVKAAASKL